MLLIATELLCCVHVASIEKTLWTLSGFKYTIDVPHVTVNKHILRVAESSLAKRSVKQGSITV